MEPEFDRDTLELLLSELQDMRDWVSRDVAAAAMIAVREKRSLDAFVAELQDQLLEVGAEIDADLDMVGQHLEEQAEV